MAFPTTLESPFKQYMQAVAQAERHLGYKLTNRYIDDVTEWISEENLPPFSLLVIYAPVVAKRASDVRNTVDVSFLYIPGVRITQRSEESTPEGVTVTLFRY